MNDHFQPDRQEYYVDEVYRDLQNLSGELEFLGEEWEADDYSHSG